MNVFGNQMCCGVRNKLQKVSCRILLSRLQFACAQFEQMLPSYKACLEYVGLEMESSYGDVCGVVGHAVLLTCWALS